MNELIKIFGTPSRTKQYDHDSINVYWDNIQIENLSEKLLELYINDSDATIGAFQIIDVEGEIQASEKYDIAPDGTLYNTRVEFFKWEGLRKTRELTKEEFDKRIENNTFSIWTNVDTD